MADLALGVKCGNSDLTSGRAGNPMVGHVFDRVIGAGGRGLFGETTEILGAEHALAERAARPAMAEKLLAATSRQAPLSDVLAYAERPQGPGLYFVDPPF